MDSLFNSSSNSAHLWAAPSPKQASFVDSGCTVWRLLPFAWLLRGSDALHPFVSVGVRQHLHPLFCHSAVNMHSSALLSSHSPSPSLPLRLTYLLFFQPTQSTSLHPSTSYTFFLFSLLNSSPSLPCRFYLGRPPLPRVMTPAGADWLNPSPRSRRRGSHQVCRFPAG